MRGYPNQRGNFPDKRAPSQEMERHLNSFRVQQQQAVPPQFDERFAHHFIPPQPFLINPPIMQQPIMDPMAGRRRERGFDKGPRGEDFGFVPPPSRFERMPLLPTPVEMPVFEQVGGDMDISRSRSPSPNSRSRRRAGYSSRQGRSRSRSPRNSTSIYQSVSEDICRDGILYMKENYYNFLVHWIGRLDEICQQSDDRDIRGCRKLIEVITKANRQEKQRITMPEEFRESDRNRMLHCELSILGLPLAVFRGSGYGQKSIIAKYSAARDLVDKCHRTGLISAELYAAIENEKNIDRMAYSQDISRAVEAILLVKKKMGKENLPKDVLTQRDPTPDVVEIFQYILRSVSMEIYYTAHPTNQVKMEPIPIPQPVNTKKLKRMMEDHMRKEDLKRKEEEIKQKVMQEMESKRKEMEEEIRKKVLEEERAKIREEMEREKRIEMMLIRQQQYELEKTRKEQELAREAEERAREQREVEEELNRLVMQLETKLLGFQQKGYSQVLEMIFASTTFKAIASLTEQSMPIDQKKQLGVDLKALIEASTMAAENLDRSTSTTSRGYPPPQPVQTTTQYHHQPPPQVEKPSTSTSSVEVTKSKDKVNRVTIGDMVLRTFTPEELRKLKPGKKVIAQDSKTGKWQLVTINRLTDTKVTLALGTAIWKKSLDEIYTEEGGQI